MNVNLLPEQARTRVWADFTFTRIAPQFQCNQTQTPSYRKSRVQYPGVLPGLHDSFHIISFLPSDKSKASRHSSFFP